MKEGLMEVLLAIVGIVVLGVVAGFIIGKVRGGIATGEKAGVKIDTQSIALDEYDYTKYDGSEIKGSEVINAIKKYENEGQLICVKVNNGRTDTIYVYSEDLSTKVKSSVDDSSSKKKYNDKAALDTYINPAANFLGTVIRDEDTEGIIRVEFVKIK